MHSLEIIQLCTNVKCHVMARILHHLHQLQKLSKRTLDINSDDDKGLSLVQPN